MTKNDLINAISAAAKIKKTVAVKALDGMLHSIQKCLQANDSLTITGFGTFSVAKRAARTGRNPRDGKVLHIPAKKVVKFKAGKNLAHSVDPAA